MFWMRNKGNSFPIPQGNSVTMLEQSVILGRITQSAFLIAMSVDPDEMPFFVASHLDVLHFPMSHLLNARLNGF